MSLAVQSNRVPSPAAQLPDAKSQTPALARPDVETLAKRLTDQGSAALENKRKEQAALADRAEFDRLQTAYDDAQKNQAEPGGVQRLDEATRALAAKAYYAQRRAEGAGAGDPTAQPVTSKQVEELFGKQSLETPSQIARTFV